MQKFYINHCVVSFADSFIRIRGKNVHFGAEKINDIYWLKNVDMVEFEAWGC